MLAALVAVTISSWLLLNLCIRPDIYSFLQMGFYLLLLLFSDFVGLCNRFWVGFLLFLLLRIYFY